jgi:hypothetical protein
MNTLFTLGALIFQHFGLIVVVWFAFVGLLSGPRTIERMFENLFNSIIKLIPKALRAARNIIKSLAHAIVQILPAKYHSEFLEVLVQFALGLTALWLFIHC